MKQSEKILREELSLENKSGAGSRNYSVKAGAGGGKTTLLSLRICKQIIKGTPIDKFVIITYTNAAAAELRDKISDRLAEIATDANANEDEKNNAKEALSSIELMQISTIHAFLLKILRENSFESGIVLDAGMLEEEEDDARKEKFFNKWYRENYDDIRNYKNDWTKEVKSSGKDRDVTREVFLNMFKDLSNVREEIIYDLTDRTEEFEKKAVEYVDTWLPCLLRFKKTIKENIPLKKDGKPAKIQTWVENILNTISEVAENSERGSKDAKELSKILGSIKSKLDENKNIYTVTIDKSILAIPEEILSLSKYAFDWDFGLIYEYMLESQKAAKVVDYVCKMQKAYQQENDNETRFLSNDDILFRADRLLSNHREILDKLRSAYSKIYVDEFQDTTGLQAKLVKMLSEKPGTNPEENDLQDDKLTLVGDPKQSIYRFTGAEKAIYDDMDRMMAEMPASKTQSVSLDTNFRSNKDIVDWVNDKFSKLMPSDYTPMDTDWVVTEPNALHGVYKWVFDGKYSKDDDVLTVVELVNKLVDNDHYFIEETVRKKDGTFDKPFLRKIMYSDIMIICRKTNNIKFYVDKFAEYGIPVDVQGKFKISGDRVLRNFELLTEYLAGYKNKKKRVTAAQILSGIDATAIDSSELKKTEERLREIRTYFREHNMTPPAIMRYLLSKEELFLPKGEELSPERIRQYRIRLNQMVETCLMNNDGDISGLADLMKAYIEKNVRREIPLESNENAVRLMNVHKSKGLTGQIVIIADRGNKEECRYSAFKNRGKFYPTVVYSQSSIEESKNYYEPSYGWDIERLKQAYSEEREEAIRLQYVAATRAAHALIIMPKFQKNAWFTDECYDYDSLPDMKQWLTDREGDTKKYDLVSEKSEKEKIMLNLNDLESNKEVTGVMELSDKQLTGITPSGLEPAGITGYSAVDPGYVKENRPYRDTFGTVMHRVYELIFIRYGKLEKMNDKDREKAIGYIIDQAILESKEDFHADDDPDEFYDFLKKKMTDYFVRVITPIMSEAEEIYPEYAFSFFIDQTERDSFISDFDKYLKNTKEKISITDEPIWINGKADLVVKRKDGSIKVYDYKSDSMNGKPAKDFKASLEKKYEGQLALYRYAIGKSFGVSDIQTELIDLYRQ